MGGLILSNSGAVTANYWLSEIYDQEIAEAHRNADIHIHDLSMLTGYCAGWSLKQLLMEGLGGITGKITSSPAKHLSCLLYTSFVASLAYGANRVHVGWGKVALLNGICSGCLGLALGLGNVISSVLPGDVTRIICFVSLFLLGFIKFLDYSIKAYINRHCCIRRNLSFSLSGLKVIVNIYGDPMAADVDGSQSLGWKETVFLALAMSIDSLVAGTMAALLDIPVAATLARCV